MKKQIGAVTVEFALVATLFFILLFGIIEFARALFVYNTLQEATRRGARVAAVCPADADNIQKVKNIVMFNTADNSEGSSVFNLLPSDVEVVYFDTDPKINISPTSDSDADSYDSIKNVRVSLIGFEHTLLIPTMSRLLFNEWAFMTTLPSESLGRLSAENPVTNRQCLFSS